MSTTVFRTFGGLALCFGLLIACGVILPDDATRGVRLVVAGSLLMLVADA